MAIKRTLRIFSVPRYGYIGRDFVVARTPNEASHLANEDLHAEFVENEDPSMLARKEAISSSPGDAQEELVDPDEYIRLLDLQKEKGWKP